MLCYNNSMSFGFFRNAFKPKSCLGVDIGTTSIKVVELEKGDQKPNLINYGILETSGYLERFNSAIQASNLNIFDQEASNYLKLILKKSNFGTRKAIASLPTFFAFTTLVDMPAMSEEDTKKSMTIHVKQYIPLPVSSVTLDWLKVGEKIDDSGNKKQQLFLIAIPTAHIENYKKIFQMAGLDLVALEIEGFSESRVLSADQGETTMIVDIGSRSTAIMITENGFLKFSGQTDFGGASLTQSLASGLNIAVQRAEMLKKQKGLSALEYGAEKELSTQILPMLNVIISEVRRVKDNYEVNYHDAVKAMVLTGGSANLLGIEKYFQEKIGLPTKKADALAGVNYDRSLEVIKSELGPKLTVAIGLAMRGI